MVLVARLGLGLAGLYRPARAGGPLRLAVACEDEGRTKACPAFLLGFVDAHPALRSVARGDAEVVLYANASEVALVDRVHLRFVGRVPGAPPVIELDVDLDTRGDDDRQRAALEPAFLRGVALFVAARDPSLVTVTLAAPDGAAKDAVATDPWDVAIDLGGSGNHTGKYETVNGAASLHVARLTPTARLAASATAEGGANRQPPLVLDDGSRVSVDTSQWRLGATLGGAHLLDRRWSVGGVARLTRDDPKGQYRYDVVGRAGVEWDAYAAADPRGNRLAVLYAIGAEADGYRLRNVLGETAARFAVHELVASGSLRQDHVTLGLALAIGGEVADPGRRHHVSASPYVEWQLGDHVDLQASLSITERTQPAPDPTMIDPLDYAQLSRLSYAEPLAINATLGITLHLDRSNGARNDRLTDL
jgi:hypothetical protein